MKTRKILLFFVIFMMAGSLAGQNVPLAGTMWYKPDTIKNSRMVYPVDSLFLLPEIILVSGAGLEYEEMEGIVFMFDSTGVFRACADYLQRKEQFENEEGLMIYERGCSDQKYKSVDWSLEEGDNMLNLVLHPLSSQAEIANIRYRLSFTEDGKMRVVKIE